MVVTQLEATMNMMAVKYVPGMKMIIERSNYRYRQMIYRHCKDVCTASAKDFVGTVY